MIDRAKCSGESSAKLDVLLPQLREVFAEGHKTLVFSQFTSMLAIVRQRLDEEGIPYAYLDGRTRDRQARVQWFQNDPNCKVFLISLKAGGLGLNLTAADYIFLLDPWWNPAVESQAIDRAHRIGQTRPVFAYRLIARDTVEEKVLELQAQTGPGRRHHHRGQQPDPRSWPGRAGVAPLVNSAARKSRARPDDCPSFGTTNTLLDAGPYFTLGIVRATDPETGKHDITIHRLSTHRRESWLDLAEAPGVG